MTAPSGNSHYTANVHLGTDTTSELIKLLAHIETIAARQTAGAAGYANGDLANHLAALTYSNTGNYGHPSGRYASHGVTYNANTAIQGVVNCLQTVLLANT